MGLPPRPKTVINPAATQRFLCGLNNVLDATVWQRNGTIMARVTVTDHAELTESDLRAACLESVGELNTPTAILLDRKARRAA